MGKKTKYVSKLLSYILTVCLIMGAVPATTFAQDSTQVTQAKTKKKKTVQMTEAKKPESKKTMQVTDVKTQKTEEVEVEKPKKEEKKEEKPTETTTQPTTTQEQQIATINETGQARAVTDHNCFLGHSGWTGLTLERANNPLTSGNYYLEDGGLTLEKTLAITGDVTLCLNGQKLTLSENASEESPVIYLDGNLTLFDNANNSGKITGGKRSGVYIQNGEFTMNGGVISNNKSYRDNNGIGVYVGKNKFTMNGGSISNNSNRYKNLIGNGAGVYVENGEFTMNNGSISSNYYDRNESTVNICYGAGVCIKGGKITIEGGSISNNHDEWCHGAGIYVENGEFTMNNGSISKNSSNRGYDVNHGGGVYLNNSEFTMTGGSISGNYAYDGAGVYVDSNNSEFTMTGGTISGNNSSWYGGGVYVRNKFTMNGGTISGNEATWGGGVYVRNEFTMNGGTLSGNMSSPKSAKGSAVYVNGTFTMTNGNITNNKSVYNNNNGAVYVSSNGTFNISGTSSIKNNFNAPESWFYGGSDNNVCLATGKIINVVGELGENTVIGVTVENPLTEEEPKREVAAGSGYTLSDTDAEKFKSDYSRYAKTFENETVYLELGEHFTVNFVTNNDSTIESQTIYQGEKVSKPTDPKKAGFTFDGWYTEEDFTNKWDFNSTVTEDMTLYAKWTEIPKYTITFESNSDSTIENQIVEEGKKITKPTVSKDGYTLDGWYTEADFVNKWNFNSEVTKDMTLYAKWTKNTTPTPPDDTDPTGTFTVTFDSQGGSAVASQSIANGGKVKMPDSPTRKGYLFGSWYKEENCTTAWDFYNDTVTKDITLYAKWVTDNGSGTTPTPPDDSDQKDKFTVTFDSQGGSAITSQSIAKDGKATKPVDPTKDGYTFDGWYKEAACTTTWNFDSDTITENITLYAKWTEKKAEQPSNPTPIPPSRPRPITPTPTNYTVTFDTNGGSEIASQTVESGKTATMPDDPTRSGYTFLGWFADKEFNDVYRFSTPVTEDVTIYAKWKKKSSSSSSGGGGGGGGSSSNRKKDTGRTGTWVTEEPKTQVVTQPIAQPTLQYQVTNPSCPRDETCPLSKFTDVDKWAWYHDSSHYCVENGLIVGTGNTTFSPNMPITRGMVVAILWRMEGKPLVNDVITFQDVKETAYYAEAVRWAAHNGIVSGYNHTKFAPNDNITREQMASILYRYAQHKGNDVSGRADIAKYKDKDDISKYAVAAIQWACDAGIINGVSATALSPKGTTTRAQAAQMFYQYLNK